MGLGPPVCEKCNLIYRYNTNGWSCGGCGDQKTRTHLFMLGCDEAKQVEDNTRFMQQVWAAQEELNDQKQ
jgi:hypothetical protein